MSYSRIIIDIVSYLKKWDSSENRKLTSNKMLFCDEIAHFITEILELDIDNKQSQ